MERNLISIGLIELSQPYIIKMPLTKISWIEALADTDKPSLMERSLTETNLREASGKCDRSR